MYIDPHLKHILDRSSASWMILRNYPDGDLPTRVHVEPIHDVLSCFRLQLARFKNHLTSKYMKVALKS